MPQLRVRPKAARGLITEVTPESAGWTYVGFSLHRLEPEDTIAAETGAREVCLVLVSGKAALQIDEPVTEARPGIEESFGMTSPDAAVVNAFGGRVPHAALRECAPVRPALRTTAGLAQPRPSRRTAERSCLIAPLRPSSIRTLSSGSHGCQSSWRAFSVARTVPAPRRSRPSRSIRQRTRDPGTGQGVALSSPASCAIALRAFRPMFW